MMKEKINFHDILYKSKINSGDSVTELIENDKGKFVASHGTIIVNGKKIEELKLIEIIYFMDMELNGKTYSNSEKLKDAIRTHVNNKEYEGVVRIFNGFKQKYQPALDEICKQIASKNGEYNLREERIDFAPYKIFMSKK